MRLSVTLLVLAALPEIAAAQSLVCDGKIISTGTSQAEVSAKCGAPVQVNHNTLYNGGAVTAAGVTVGSAADVQVEVWTYNFGPNKLMQRIRFEDGLVVSIDSLGYGF